MSPLTHGLIVATTLGVIVFGFAALMGLLV